MSGGSFRLRWPDQMRSVSASAKFWIMAEHNASRYGWQRAPVHAPPPALTFLQPFGITLPSNEPPALPGGFVVLELRLQFTRICRE
jgi:hypothetical protein